MFAFTGNSHIFPVKGLITMKKAKRWIVSAGACLLALTSMSVGFGQIPTAPIPELNNDGLPLLTEPAPMDVSPIEPILAPAEPADVPAPTINAIPNANMEPIPAPAQSGMAPVAPAPTPSIQPQAPAPMPAPQMQPQMPPQTPTPGPTTAAPTTQQPCQQCSDPCQTCPSGAYYSSTPYYGQDTRPWWLNIRPVPYTPVEHEHHGIGVIGRPVGFGGHVVRDRYGRLAPIEPPFYTTRGPRDFYLDNPRPLGY